MTPRQRIWPNTGGCDSCAQKLRPFTGSGDMSGVGSLDLFGARGVPATESSSDAVRGCGNRGCSCRQAGRQLHPRFPHPRTASLLLSVAGTPRAPKRSKLPTPDMSPLPVKGLNFCAQESHLLIHSIEGQAILTTLNLTLMADALSTTSDMSHCDTVSWGAENPDSASLLSSRTFSTEGSCN